MNWELAQVRLRNPDASNRLGALVRKRNHRILEAMGCLEEQGIAEVGRIPT